MSALNNWKERNAPQDAEWEMRASGGEFGRRPRPTYSPGPTVEQLLAKAQTAVVDELMAILKAEIKLNADGYKVVSDLQREIKGAESRFAKKMLTYTTSLRNAKKYA